MYVRRRAVAPTVLLLVRTRSSWNAETHRRCNDDDDDDTKTNPVEQLVISRSVVVAYNQSHHRR